MRKLVFVTLLSTVISGCAALPVPIQIASWALDGLSVITTRKSLTDHGLSMVSEQDCALWRGLTEGSICRDNAIEVEVLTAAVSSPDSLRQPVLQITTPGIAPSLDEIQPTLSEMYLDVI